MRRSLDLLGRPGTALGLAPRGDGVTTAGGAALTTTVRMVHGVHDNTSDGRPHALPTHAAGFAPVDVGLLGVADLADGGAAGGLHVADLPGGHAQLRVLALLGDQLDGGAGAAGDLGSATGTQLDRVTTVPVGM